MSLDTLFLEVEADSDRFDELRATSFQSQVSLGREGPVVAACMEFYGKSAEWDRWLNYVADGARQTKTTSRPFFSHPDRHPHQHGPCASAQYP